ncbi:MAG: hypothetical protein EBU90_29320 [Proteobacteria bacterium]|nr:hypothetical protein [Pseudomonadota bacterium]NBP16859.1 hypothetical protein [bacterium]
MSSFDQLVNKLTEQSSAPEPVSMGRVIPGRKTVLKPYPYPKHGMEDEEKDKEEEGELMTHMKQQGLIPKGSKPTSTYSGTMEKR